MLGKQSPSTVKMVQSEFIVLAVIICRNGTSLTGQTWHLCGKCQQAVKNTRIINPREVRSYSADKHGFTLFGGLVGLRYLSRNSNGMLNGWPTLNGPSRSPTVKQSASPSAITNKALTGFQPHFLFQIFLK